MKPRSVSLRRSMTLINLSPDKLREKRGQKTYVSGMREDTEEIKFLIKTPQEMLLMQMALLIE